MKLDRARARLDELALRIERLSTSPESVRAPFVRLMRPILSRLDWQAPASIEACSRLIAQISELARGGPDEDLATNLAAAIEELEDNVAGVERLTALEHKVFFSRAAWLRRVYEVLIHAAGALRDLADRANLEVASGVDRTRILPPLDLSAEQAAEGEEPAEIDDEATRLFTLQTGAIDRLLDAAREETELLGRRRRLLEAARRLLVETSAAIPLDRSGVEARMRHIAEEVTRLDRLQARGVSPDIGLLHQALSAQARGERDKLYASLLAIHERAVGRGDPAFAGPAALAIDKLCAAFDPRAPEAISGSLDRSGRELLGEEVIEAVRRGHAMAASGVRTPQKLSSVQRSYYETMLKSLQLGVERSTVAAALAVDGSFELGGVMSPVRITEHTLRLESVAFPTPDLRLEPAGGPEDVPTAVIEDPRTLLLSLASGRLLARRFTREVREPRSRTVMRGEARVYVLDGSGSMIGPRAKMRDAILVAELATLVRRAAEPDRHTRVVVFFRYFDAKIGPTTRIDNPEDALSAITELMYTHRTGGTNIEAALIASLEEVRDAKQRDPDLARAQIVLVTDGEAPVDEQKVQRAREEIAGDVSLGVSIIALGEENPVLRRLVAGQRARGERAFYHFMSDAMLESISKGEIDRGPALHLPALPRKDVEPIALAAELEQEVGQLLEEMAAIARTRDAALLAGPDGSSEAAAARAEAILGDDRRLEHRFRRWFPEPVELGDLPPRMPEAGTIERADAELAQAVLATIGEVVALVEGSERTRRADAVDLLERMLPDARLSPARYQAIIRDHPASVAKGLASVHASVRWGILKSIRARQSGLATS